MPSIFCLLMLLSLFFCLSRLFCRCLFFVCIFSYLFVRFPVFLSLRLSPFVFVPLFHCICVRPCVFSYPLAGQSVSARLYFCFPFVPLPFFPTSYPPWCSITFPISSPTFLKLSSLPLSHFVSSSLLCHPVSSAVSTPEKRRLLDCLRGPSIRCFLIPPLPPRRCLYSSFRWGDRRNSFIL